MVRTILLALVFGLFGLTAAQAASFDCAKASTSFETAICNDPGLSKSDETLLVAYQTAIGGLSAPALAKMKAGQKSWLDLAARACTKDGELATAAYDADGVACLQSVFERRVELLENSKMMGGLRFYNGEAFATGFDPDGGEYQPVATKMLSTPRLDGDTAEAQAFNDFIAGQSATLSGTIEAGAQGADFDVTTDDWDTMHVIKVNEARISAEDTVYQSPHGAAHGSYGITYVHYLRDKQRALEADDIFTGKAWKKKLLDLAYKALQAELGENMQLEKAADIADVVIEPARWNFSDTGLEIIFQPYEVASYADGTPTVTIPWSALADDMTADADAIARY